MLAESTRALRVDVPGQSPTLWFPWDDVRVATVRSRGLESRDGGAVEQFDAVAPAPARRGEVRWTDEAPAIVGGAGVILRCVTPPSGLDALLDYAVVDHNQARVDLEDAVDGDDPRDVTVKRFPTWGDAKDLIAVLEGRTAIADTTRPVVEGSQLLGQAVLAAMRAAPGRRVVSAHMVFLRAADATEPVAMELTTLTSGRTFITFEASAMQRERLCASGTLLLGTPAPDVVHHEPSMDGVPGPYDSVPYDMGVTGRDLRVVEAAYTDDPGAPVGPPTIDAWVRYRTVPDDAAVHAGLLTQFTGHMSIAAALRPHEGIGQREAHRTMSTAINAIGISFHADVHVDRWMLYRHFATVVSDGMSHSECRVQDEAGHLLASFTVDAMIRPLERAGVDPRTAL
jgi:acyl-CoA thioesterase